MIFDDIGVGNKHTLTLFIYSLDNTYLLSFLHMPSTFLGNEKIAGTKIDVSGSRS